MQINESILTTEEIAEFKIRELLQDNGFSRFKMAKFEEYDLYAQNRNFLPTNKIITFTDVDGRLLALKPDVTLSIIRHSVDEKASKVYYAENVYRVSKHSGGFKEIRQVGAECIGDVENAVASTVSLATKSLSQISDEFVLDVSHLGFVGGMLQSCSVGEQFRDAVLDAICSKNRAKLSRVSEKAGVDKNGESRLQSLIDVFGRLDQNIAKMRELAVNEQMQNAVKELEQVNCEVQKSSNADKVFIDFSVVNNVSYYDGIVMRGFIGGISEGVLFGGEYSRLAKRLGSISKAVGFVVYLNELENI